MVPTRILKQSSAYSSIAILASRLMIFFRNMLSLRPSGRARAQVAQEERQEDLRTPRHSMGSGSGKPLLQNDYTYIQKHAYTCTHHARPDRGARYFPEKNNQRNVVPPKSLNARSMKYKGYFARIMAAADADAARAITVDFAWICAGVTRRNAGRRRWVHRQESRAGTGGTTSTGRTANMQRSCSVPTSSGAP
jgi:hypothetical protein